MDVQSEMLVSIPRGGGGDVVHGQDRGVVGKRGNIISYHIIYI